MRRRLPIVFLPLLLAACDESGTAVVMPAGYESAALGRAFKDVRAERPKARLVREGDDVYLQETNKPPLYAHARIWFHDASQGPVPADDALVVNRAIFTTLSDEAVRAAASQAAHGTDAQVAGMRQVQAARFDSVKEVVVRTYGKPATCEPERLACTWEKPDLQVRLFTIDALDAQQKPVPVALRQVLRRKDAADVPPPEPIALGPDEKAAGAPAPLLDSSKLRFEPPEPIKVPEEFLKNPSGRPSLPVLPSPPLPPTGGPVRRAPPAEDEPAK